MECSRCPLAPVVHAFIKANPDKSLGRTKSRQIHAAAKNLKDRMDNLCSSCSSLSNAVRRQLNKLISDFNLNYDKLSSLISSFDSSTDKALSDLQSAFSALCLVCSRDSNDDNPSNHGQTFYSLDSGSCNANSGKAHHSATDDNVVLSRADWIASHASTDYCPSSFASDPRSALIRKEELSNSNSNSNPSSLPPDIEDTIRLHLSNFASLDIFDKMLISCVFSGMNIAEFAKMLWLPFSIVNPLNHTIRPITKQAAHARWSNIIRKFPVFASIAAGRLASNSNSTLSRRQIQLAILNPNSNLPDNQFSNGKPLRKRKSNPSNSSPASTSLSFLSSLSAKPSPRLRSSSSKIQPLIPGLLY